MADVPAISVETGQPVSVPQEAAAAQHAAGKIAFAPGTRVPITWNGQQGTVPAERLDEALQEHGAELNFDPSGATKAAAAGALRGATFGASDWAAIEGQRWAGDYAGAEKTRQTLEGLRQSHPHASMVSEAVGALLPMLVPGGAEAEAPRLAEGAEAARGLAEAANVAKEAPAAAGIEGGLAGAGAVPDAAQAASQARETAIAGEAAQTADQIRAAQAKVAAVARADALQGRTLGSSLASIFRHGNPNALLGRAGAGVEEALAPTLGTKGAMAARWATEGAVGNVAMAADESELGDENLTGEAMFAAAAEGMVFGSALGLVGTGAERALTGAGRMAARIAEGRLGGTATQYRTALERWGVGGLGNFALEEGIETPFATDAEKYARSRAVAGRVGAHLESVARQADARYGGASAAEGRAALHEAIDRVRDDAAKLGVNLDRAAQNLKDGWDLHVGWKGDPAPLQRLPPETADALYEAAWRKEGLVDPATKPPRDVTEMQVRRRWRELADAEGLGSRDERLPAKATPEAVGEYHRKIADLLNDPATPLAEKKRLGVLYMTPGAMEREALADLHAQVAARNDRRLALRKQASAELQGRHVADKQAWDDAMQRHVDLRKKAEGIVANEQAKRDLTHAHAVAATRRANQQIVVPFTKAREFRSNLDAMIPWNRRGPDATTNFAVDMKRAARAALEDHVEGAIDGAIRSAGDDPELLARYAHAKARYGLAKDVENMLERQRGREASRTGREVFGHYGGIVGHALGGAMFGHPAAGVAVGIGKKYAPSVAAWLGHKVARLAELKALRAELQVATRRSARAATGGGRAARYARLSPEQLPPHEMRATAADAMLAISKFAKSGDLKGRLAALDPGASLVAPKSALAAEGTARRSMTWILGLIPPRIQAMIMRGHEPRARDLSDSEARDFMEGSAAALDPRYATDALAAGHLTPAVASANKAVFPAMHAQTAATIAREQATGRDRIDALPPGHRSQLGLMGMPSSDPKGMTLALQNTAAGMAGAAASKQQPAGKVNAASGLSKMTGATMLQLQSQSLESSGPGRRGRKSSGP